jgi:hypothetical protein
MSDNAKHILSANPLDRWRRACVDMAQSGEAVTYIDIPPLKGSDAPSYWGFNVGPREATREWKGAKLYVERDGQYVPVEK